MCRKLRASAFGKNAKSLPRIGAICSEPSKKPRLRASKMFQLCVASCARLSFRKKCEKSSPDRCHLFGAIEKAPSETCCKICRSIETTKPMPPNCDTRAPPGNRPKNLRYTTHGVRPPEGSSDAVRRPPEGGTTTHGVGHLKAAQTPCGGHPKAAQPHIAAATRRQHNRGAATRRRHNPFNRGGLKISTPRDIHPGDL